MTSPKGRHSYRLAALLLVAGLSALIVACGATATPTVTPALPTATVRAAASATRPVATPALPGAPAGTQAPAAAPSATVQPSATLSAAAPVSAVPATTPGGISFAADIQPIFQQNCIRCHGGATPTQGMSLESYAGAIKGSRNGPVVVPFAPEQSLMYQYTRDGIMPYGGPRLAAADVEKIRAWIAAGAPNN